MIQIIKSIKLGSEETKEWESIGKREMSWSQLIILSILIIICIYLTWLTIGLFSIPSGIGAIFGSVTGFVLVIFLIILNVAYSSEPSRNEVFYNCLITNKRVLVYQSGKYFSIPLESIENIKRQLGKNKTVNLVLTAREWTIPIKNLKEEEAEKAEKALRRLE